MAGSAGPACPTLRRDSRGVNAQAAPAPTCSSIVLGKLTGEARVLFYHYTGSVRDARRSPADEMRFLMDAQADLAAHRK